MADEITPKEEIPVEAPIEVIPEPIQVSEATTAQIPVSEPLEIEPETKPESVEIPEVKTGEILPVSEPVIKPEIVSSKQTQDEPISEPENIPEVKPIETKSEPTPEPKPEVIIPAVTILSQTKTLARELLVKARSAIQTRKRKKLNQIMTLFAKQTKITNDEVEKLLHVSDATATRYLSQLEKEGKIKQTGKTGKYVFYSKI